MAENINDGGPAFPPNAGWRDNQADGHGMSLRDWFAGQALAGLLSHPDCQPVGPGFEATTGMAAGEAYAVADAMLAARSR